MTGDALSQPIRSERDLERLWRRLMGDLGSGRRTLWLLRIGSDDCAIPQITQIDDVPNSFEGRAAKGLVEVLTGIDSRRETRWAFLLSRPGTGGATAEDRAWVAALARACRHADVRHEVVHLATDETLVPIPLDDLLTSAS